jgi:hypothetical protein
MVKSVVIQSNAFTFFSIFQVVKTINHMKIFATSVALLLLTTTTFAQSESFQVLREKFRGEKDVVALHTSGNIARTILWVAGEEEIKEVLEDVKRIRLMVVPKRAFRDQNVSLKGFKEVAQHDSFEEIAHAKDGHDDVTLMLQTSYKQKHNRYLLVVDSEDEVVVMEILGYIDPKLAFYKTYREKITYN